MDNVSRGLFINNKKAKDSIYESGHMVYECLKLSDKFVLDYCEVDVNDRTINIGYDFYFFNYHPVTMGWLQTAHLKKELGYVITMILEVAPGDAFIMCPERHFNFYCALDPTITSAQKNLYAFPRPLEKINFELPIVKNEIPVIGSFGFATKGKGFHHVVEAVNKEFDKAIVKINIPYGDFVPESKEYAFYLGEICKQKAKPGIEVQVTHDFMSKEALIKWCVGNSLNCFLYDRDMPGLSATTDQAIVSEKPMAVSDNDTFRHITAYLTPYPKMSLKESMETSAPIIKKMEEDWLPEKFKNKFEEILFKNITTVSAEVSGKYVLPVKTKSLRGIFLNRMKRYRRKIKKITIKKIFSRKKSHEII